MMFSVIPDFMQSSILRNPEADNKKENRAIGGGGNLKNSNTLGIPKRGGQNLADSFLRPTFENQTNFYRGSL